jgi:Glycine zipper
MSDSIQNAQNTVSRNSMDADGVPPPPSARSRELAGAAAGAAIGSAVGVFCGPVGILAGALFGAAVGALAGRTSKEADTRAEKNDAALDAEIGVSGGDIGAPSLRSWRLPEHNREAYSFADVEELYSEQKYVEERKAA